MISAANISMAVLQFYTYSTLVFDSPKVIALHVLYCSSMITVLSEKWQPPFIHEAAETVRGNLLYRWH